MINVISFVFDQKYHQVVYMYVYVCPINIHMSTQIRLSSQVLKTTFFFIKTKTLLPQAYVTLDDLSYPVQTLWFVLLSKTFKLFVFPVLLFWVYMMKVILETCAHYMWYLPFYYFDCLIYGNIFILYLILELCEE